MREQGPGTPGLQSGFRGMGLCAQNLVHVRCSPSVSEISTQVRPCQASMHPTKSPPPSHPQQPLSRPPSPPAPQGRRGACQEVMSTGSSRRCSHWEALWQPPSLTLTSDALRPQRASAREPPLACSQMYVHIGILGLPENTCWP